MGWIHDTGYSPAYEHAGFPAAVLADGSETSTVSNRIAGDVVGWRAGCDCGWRGTQFYPRSEFPSATGLAPALVDGFDTLTGTYAEWDRHLAQTLPELEIHDRARQLRAVEARLHQAISTARDAGLPWSTIDRITSRAGIQIRREPGAPGRTASGGIAPHRRTGGPHRSADGPNRGPS